MIRSDTTKLTREELVLLDALRRRADPAAGNRCWIDRQVLSELAPDAARPIELLAALLRAGKLLIDKHDALGWVLQVTEDHGDDLR